MTALPTSTSRNEGIGGSGADRLVFLVDQSEAGGLPLGGTRRILRKDGTLTSGSRTVVLPAARFELDNVIRDGNLAAWEPVLEWLVRECGPTGIVVFAPDDPIRELGLLGMARRSLAYGINLAQTPPRITLRDYPVFGSAAILILPNQDSEKAFSRAYVPWYNGVLATADASRLDQALATADRLKAPERNTAPTGGTVPRILLVAYFSGPARTVGVQRINYWHRNIPSIWPGATVTIATATPWDQPDPTVLRLPDLGAGALFQPSGAIPDWGKAFLESERNDAKSVATLSNCWRIGLETWFENAEDEYDVVILSGNPFGVFDFAAFAKRKWSARVILDYRDPFSNNPRMAYRPEARQWARYLEKGYNLQADLVTVVNDDCALMVEAKEDVPVAVVMNGFDESTLPTGLSRLRDDDGVTHFVHTGTLYPGRSPGPLIGELHNLGHKFHHVGNPAALEALKPPSETVEIYGIRPYRETLEIISRADCGVVFVHDNGFDTPTKLFDYMAYGLDVLIVTDGEHGAGSAGKLVEGVERVFWVTNTPKAIADFLRDYRPASERRPHDVAESFSRRATTRKLLDEIAALLGVERPEPGQRKAQ